MIIILGNLLYILHMRNIGLSMSLNMVANILLCIYI